MDVRPHSWVFYNPGRSESMDGWICTHCKTTCLGSTPPNAEGLEFIGASPNCNEAAEQNEAVDREIEVMHVLYE